MAIAPKGFIFDKQLGRGACCRVYLATRAGETKPSCAVKVFERDSEKYFRRELRLLTALRECQYVAEIIEASAMVDERGYCIPYMVMPNYYMDLEHFLGRYIDSHGGALPMIVMAKIARQIFLALAYLASAHIIHADIKPANILFRRMPVIDPGRIADVSVVLCDFSTSRDVRKIADRVADPAYVGTVPYIAPEILLGKRFDASADVWSAMLVVYFMFTGRDLLDVHGELDMTYEDSALMAAVYAESDDKLSSFDSRLGGGDKGDSKGSGGSGGGGGSSGSSGSSGDDGGGDEHGDYSSSADQTFNLIYAHLVLLYKFLGRPPDDFVNLAPAYYREGRPRYSPEVKEMSVSRFTQLNYIVDKMSSEEIEEFLRLGLRYMPRERLSAAEIANAPLLNKFNAAPAPAAPGKKKKKRKKNRPATTTLQRGEHEQQARAPNAGIQ